LKPDCRNQPTEVGGCGMRQHILRYAAPYLVRTIKPNPIASHDWHVQPICQRSLRLIRLSGAVWIEARAVTPRCPRTCCARRSMRSTASNGVFARTF
jgi:hypothetical protein